MLGHCNTQIDSACRDKEVFLSKEPEWKLCLGKMCFIAHMYLGHLHIQCRLQGFAEQPRLFNWVHIFPSVNL